MKIYKRGTLAYSRPLVGMLLLLAMLASLFLLNRPEQARAHNDTCVGINNSWLCEWYDTSLPTTTRHWFSANITKRNWQTGQVADPYVNTMQKKCVAIKDTDGVIYQVACGGGSPLSTIPAAWRPGWMFNYHWADGNRHISSYGTHPK